jgi:hypothetical protein
MSRKKTAKKCVVFNWAKVNKQGSRVKILLLQLNRIYWTDMHELK